MKKAGSSGNSNTEAFVILAILVIIFLANIGKFSPKSSAPNISKTNDSISSINKTPSSPYAKHISLGSGNAKFSYQPYEEYVTITNSGQESVNITGWKLENGKGERAYDFSGKLTYFESDKATLGKAVAFISPQGFNIPQDILLKSGEMAIVTTGKYGVQTPYPIVSFKENKCSGYLEDLRDYEFVPQLSRNCPIPRTEIGVENMDTECRKFIERMSSCHTPDFETRDKDGSICYNCVDRKPLSGACVAFIKRTFNYGACISNHASDPDFSGKTWRIFLGKGWEMWASDYESIKLFDQMGRMIDSINY